MKFAATRRERAPNAYEPTLDEALTDPLVLLILKRDGLAADEVRSFLEQVRRRLRSRVCISIFGQRLRFPAPAWVPLRVRDRSSPDDRRGAAPAANDLCAALP
jgi:hypothetical protein